MYLSFNNKIIKDLFICFILVLFQAYLPNIFISQNLSLSLDVLLIFLTFMVLEYETSYIIILSFIFSIISDFIIQYELLGLSSLIKTISVYCISKIKSTNNLWLRYHKIIYIFIIYFIHFGIFYYINIFHFNSMLLIISFIHSIFALLFFLLIEKLFHNSKLL